MPPALTEKGTANAEMTAILTISDFVVNNIYKLPFEKLTSGSLCLSYYRIATELRHYCYRSAEEAIVCQLP
jgi:hypothetical protein